MGSCPDTDIDQGILKHFLKRTPYKSLSSILVLSKMNQKRDKKWTCFSQTSNKLGL